MKENSLLVLFSGTELRKTNDEYYPFYAERNFVYLTGLSGKESVLLIWKDGAGTSGERVYSAAGSDGGALDGRTNQACKSG